MDVPRDIKTVSDDVTDTNDAFVPFSFSNA